MLGKYDVETNATSNRYSARLVTQGILFPAVVPLQISFPQAEIRPLPVHFITHYLSPPAMSWSKVKIKMLPHPLRVLDKTMVDNTDVEYGVTDNTFPLNPANTVSSH